MITLLILYVFGVTSEYDTKVAWVDGAGYHCARQEKTNFYASGITIKHDIKPFIQQNPKIKTLKYKGKVYKRNEFWNAPNAKSKPPGPGRDGLQEGLIEWLKEFKPDELKTDFEREMEKIAIKVFFNLPMHPEMNPIELNWALWKQCIAKCFFWNRSMLELEKQMLKSMNGGDPVKIVKKITLPDGEVIEAEHVCDCNPDGVTDEVQRKHIKHAVTEIQKLLIEKNGSGDILTRNNKESKWRLENYHHMSFKRLRVEFSGTGTEVSSLPTGKEFEILQE